MCVFVGKRGVQKDAENMNMFGPLYLFKSTEVLDLHLKIHGQERSVVFSNVLMCPFVVPRSLKSLDRPLNARYVLCMIDMTADTI